MIFELGDAYPADATERALPDATSALALIALEAPCLPARLRDRHARWAQRYGSHDAGRIRCIEAATVLGIARLGHRHGRYGDDFHAYHNEGHALDLLLGRIDRLQAHPAAAALGQDDWLSLELFAALHDLRQREHGSSGHPLGANEAASIAEGRRILTACGLEPRREPDLYTALELMIAGSTFDARPSAAAALDPEGNDNSAELAAGGGALAPRLRPWLQQAHPRMAAEPAVARGLHLACVAADLDTANVGEDFLGLCRSAVQLAEEREMRAGRRLGAPLSAAPCREFLMQAQLRYLDELHRFASAEGEAWLGARKRDNRARMQALVRSLEAADCAFQRAANGQAVLAAFSEAALAQDRLPPA